jgi:radical SAM-linked protein
MRFTGHLDLHRAWERTFRRARLPLAYTQGFHPQPRIQLAGALPLGFTSACEIADIWLEEDVPADAALEALKIAVPPGITKLTAEAVDDRLPPLQVLLRSATYSVGLGEPIADLSTRIAELLAATELPRVRRDKAYDLRPLIEALSVGAEPDRQLEMQLAARDAATGRPEEVVDVLGGDPVAAHYHRTALLLADPDAT